ncbi:carboxymuconolactone decarboxylase family protein [Chitinophaga cymbidii]|uniref:Alkyl hydroperoxide reductase AhpD n=1 Tax=Chitinophaga cymbidii TaxID=1096750 RepID=A0A512RR97_9BACT|nr:carboxymuconolactone decarboxylase family protein [Chitinophaga cymbidii]GEP98196.1 alkyl hydroperoxide reductase AhpD [Chitinophaga cymbidii]
MFANNTTQDTAQQVLKVVGISLPEAPAKLQALATTDARYLKDLKINVTNALEAGTLEKKEAYLLGLAVAVNEKIPVLQQGLEQLALAAGATDKEVADVVSCTSLMNANNVYYRFRHFVNKEFYTTAPAGIRMSIMANPVIGKEFFELVSLVVSALNGCEMCVTSHEEALLKHGTGEQRILDAVRLGAVIKSLGVLL